MDELGNEEREEGKRKRKGEKKKGERKIKGEREKEKEWGTGGIRGGGYERVSRLRREATRSE